VFVVVTLSLQFPVAVFSAIDPCHSTNHKIFRVAGSRNEKCDRSDREHELCDNHLEDGWYAAPNATMLNQAPITGSCGFDIPLWMIGSPFYNTYIIVAF